MIEMHHVWRKGLRPLQRRYPPRRGDVPLISGSTLTTAELAQTTDGVKISIDISTLELATKDVIEQTCGNCKLVVPLDDAITINAELIIPFAIVRIPSSRPRRVCVGCIL